jgi:hypothetical protein
MAASPFSEELRVFEEHRDEWLRSNVGKFVAIQGEQVGGFFSSYAEAFRSGLARFGAEHEFLIKQVCLTEPIYYIS